MHGELLHTILRKIVSGGQTGTDRAALNFAITHNIPHGGWCPKGRLAEDGAIDARFKLQETPSNDSLQRTEWNVRDSDGTVILSLGPRLSGGSQLTARFAIRHAKPWIHISAADPNEAPESAFVNFLQENNIHILNVAGPRESEEPGVERFVKKLLEKAFSPIKPTTPL